MGDMVTPQALSQGLFSPTRGHHDVNDRDPEEEEELDASQRQIKLPERRNGPDTPLRKQLLAAVRQDDAPGVLQFVADGANVIDMGEALRLAAHRGSASVV